MKTEILKILRQSDGFVSGQELCDRLHVSRTAIWKRMKKLQEEGYVIEAVQNKGYRLAQAPDLIQADEVRSWLHSRWLGKEIYAEESVDSTNTWAKKLAEEGAPHGTVVLADEQTAGKGRRGRVWENPRGVNLAFTFLLRPDFQPEAAPMLTLVMGLSVAQVCRDFGLDAWIKWPNDVVVNRKKICGILTEMSAQIDYVNYVVLGTGININQKSIPEELEDRATSFYLETGKCFSRAQIAAAVIEKFEENYEIFIQTCDLSTLQDSYNQILVNRNQQVKVLDLNHEFTGTAQGITSGGELLVRTENGKTEKIMAGEVSVRGFYGYV